MDQRPEGVVADEGLDPHLSEDVYLRFTPSQRKVIERRHNHLSNRFREWLRRAGADRISAEDKAIDVRCDFAGASYLFELKCVSFQTTRHAVRESLGQLLEYACYPGRRRPQHLAIVLDTAPGTNEVAWLQEIQRMGIAIELFWLQGDTVFCANRSGTTLSAKAQHL